MITNAADGLANVKALVYIDAFVPDIGQDIFHIGGEQSMIPNALEIKFTQVPPTGPGDVDLYLKRDMFRAVFAADVPKNQPDLMAVTQRPLGAAAGTPSKAAAFEEIPSCYLLGREDRAITPDAQRAMATNAHSTIVEVDSSHASPVWHPDAVAELIEQAARAPEVHSLVAGGYRDAQ